MKSKKNYYTKFTFSTVAKNNWSLGGHALCYYSDSPSGMIKMEVSWFDESQQKTEKGLINFLNGGNTNKIECVGSAFTANIKTKK